VNPINHILEELEKQSTDFNNLCLCPINPVRLHDTEHHRLKWEYQSQDEDQVIVTTCYPDLAFIGCDMVTNLYKQARKELLWTIIQSSLLD